MGRLILGIVAGIVVALATSFAIILVGHQFYPLPSDLYLHDPESAGALTDALPAGALALVVIAWFAGAFDGGLVAAVVSRSAWTVWPVAALLAVAGVVHVLMIPHPLLLQIGAVVAPLLGGLAAGLIANRMRPDGG